MADLLRDRDQRRACRMAQSSVENLNKLGLPKKKGWPQPHKMSSWQDYQSLFCQIELEEQDHQSRSLDCEMGESQDEREPHLG